MPIGSIVWHTDRRRDPRRFRGDHANADVIYSMSYLDLKKNGRASCMPSCSLGSMFTQVFQIECHCLVHNRTQVEKEHIGYE
jgi:hypothetical protein